MRTRRLREQAHAKKNLAARFKTLAEGLSLRSDKAWLTRRAKLYEQDAERLELEATSAGHTRTGIADGDSRENVARIA